MKNFILVLALGLAIVATIVAVGVAADVHNIKKDFVDSTAVAEMQSAQVNPEFSTVDDVLQFRYNLITDRSTDSAVIAMSEKTLVDVSTVCLKKKNKIHLHDIVNELLQNRDVYLNLPDTPPSSKPTTDSAAPGTTITPTDGSIAPPEPMSRTVSFKDTIVNGKHVLLKITAELYDK